MNERMRELATEVGISVEYLTNTKQLEMLERFAELIVQECIGEAIDEVAFRGGDVAIEAGIRLRLQQHFGVKE